MKPFRNPFLLPTAVRATLLATLALSSLGYAASKTWYLNGLTDNWDMSAFNWDSGAATWAANDTATFIGAGEAINMTSAISAAGLTFGGNGYSIGSANSSVLTLAGATVEVTNGTDTATISAKISGSAGLTKNGNGTLTLTGANDYAGGTIINGGTLQIGNGTVNGTIGTGIYDLTSSNSILRLNYATVAAPTWANIKGSGILSLNSAQPLNGSAQWGTAGLSSGASGFNGTLRIERGRVQASPTQLGSTTELQIQDGGQFLATSGTFTQSIKIAGNGYGESNRPGALRAAGNNDVTFNGNITLTADATVFAQDGTNTKLTLGGAITGNYVLELNTRIQTAPSNSNIYVTPAGTTQNTYLSTKINGSTTTALSGSVIAGNQYAFSTGGLEVAFGNLKLNGYNFSFANLKGTGGTIGNYGATNSVITVGSDGNSTASATPMVDGGVGKLGLIKTGDGTLTLSGTNTYTGDTTVSAGTLLVSGALGSTAVSVGAAGTIGGDGVIGGSLAFAAGGKFSFTLGQTLSVNGGSNAVSFLDFGVDDIVNLSGSTNNGTYTLIDGTMTINTANLDNIGAGDAFALGGGKSAYFVTGSSLNLVVIPEPEAAFLGSLGLLALLRRRRV